MLNKICANTFLPKKALADLETDKNYMVTAIKQVSTRFGLKVVVSIDEEFQVFLPDRASKALEKNNNLFSEMAQKANQYSLFLVYHGDNKFEFSGL